MADNVGTLVMVKIGTALLVGEISSSFASAANMIETSNKSTGRDSSYEYGRVNKTLSISSIASTDSTLTAANFNDLVGYQDAGTKPDVEVTQYTDKTGGTPEIGKLKISGSVLVSNVNMDNPDNDRLTFSADFQFDETVTIAANA